MNKHGKWLLAALVALALAGNVPQALADGNAPADEARPVATAAESTQGPADLERIVVAPDEATGPVITIEASEPVEYEATILDDPTRLVIDLNGTVSRLDRGQYAVGARGVVRVRAGQFRKSPVPVSRVVFDLDRTLDYAIERDGSALRVAFRDVATSGPPAEAAQASPGPTSAAEPTTAAAATPEPAATRAVEPDALDKFLRAPAFAAETEASAGDEAPAAAESSEAPMRAMPATSFETQRIVTDSTQYTGKKISMNLVDTDIKQIFRLFHEISGLNFVLDPGVDGKVTIVLDNVPWDQALDIILKNNGLDKVLENNVLRIATTQKLAQEAAARKQLKEAKELEVEPITITRTLSYAKAKDVERVIREGGILSPRGKVIVDERTNALIVSDIPKKVEPLDQLVSTLDAETPQVMIEARIVETSKSFVQDFGVQWGFNAFADAAHGTQTKLNFPRNASAKYSLNLPGSGSASNLAFKFGNILDSFTLDLALNALETEGRGRILSSPKIATQNNERAEIEQGVRIPVVNTTATEINVEFVSASLRMSVTPQITAEGTVILDVNVENNTPDFVNRVGDVPPINTQRAQTKILISDGGTAVIGGIFVVNEGTSEAGVPWFRKIPGLGWLFKTRNITNENRELLIFLTPKIMKVS